jgi:hypothetical protein
MMANQVGRHGACGVARSAHALSRVRATGARTKWFECVSPAIVPLGRRSQAALRVVNSGEEALKSSRYDESRVTPQQPDVNADGVRLVSTDCISRQPVHASAGTLQAVTIVDGFDRLLRSVRPAHGHAAGERIPFAAAGPKDDAPREVTRFAAHRCGDQRSSFSCNGLRCGEESARCCALRTPTGCALRWPLRRTEGVPCGTGVMTPPYACAMRASTTSAWSSCGRPSRKSPRRAARRRRQCPKARPPAGSKRSEEH